MPGFRFRYRLNGAPPTLERLPFNQAETLSDGDIVSLDAGELAVAATGDGNLLGAAQGAEGGTGPATLIEVVTDADAVYAVTDRHLRLQEDSLDLTGATAAQGVGDGPNGDFAVVVGSSDAEETLVRISAGRHVSDRLSGGNLNAALVRAVVRIHKDYVARGPVRAQAFFHANVVVVLMHDVMTTAERALVSSGRPAAVLDLRQQLQRSMRRDLVAAVERLTAGKVTAFMSDNHIDPDMAVEVFVLDRPVRTASPRPDDVA